MPWDPRTPSGLQFWMPTAYTSGMWTEDTSTYEHTNVANSGDTAGIIFDPSVNAHRVCSSSGSSPTFTTTGHNAAVAFSGSQYYTIENSAGSFNYIHATSPSYTIGVWINVTTIGTAQTVIDSVLASSGSNSVGCSLIITTTGKITWLVCKGVTGTPAVNSTTTAGLTAGTMCYVEINCNSGSGTINVNGTTSSFTHSGGSSSNASNGLSVGARASSNGVKFTGSMADLCIYNANLGGSDLTSYQSYNPSPTSATLAQQTNGSASIAATDLSHLHQWWDYSVKSRLWTTTARSTNVASGGDSIAYVDHGVGLGYALNRNGSQGTGANCPTFTANLNTSGNGGATFDGSLSDLPFTQTMTCNGAVTLFIVAQCNASNNGSHLIQGADYVVATGTGYNKNGIGQGGPGGPYSLVHTSSGTATPFNLQPTPTGMQIFEMVRQGNSFSTFVNGYPSLLNPKTIASALTFSSQGKNWSGLTSAWMLNGSVGELAMYTTAHSVSSRDALRLGLAAKWNVPVVLTSGNQPVAGTTNWRRPVRWRGRI